MSLLVNMASFIRKIRFCEPGLLSKWNIGGVGTPINVGIAGIQTVHNMYSERRNVIRKKNVPTVSFYISSIVPVCRKEVVGCSYLYNRTHHSMSGIRVVRWRERLGGSLAGLDAWNRLHTLYIVVWFGCKRSGYLRLYFSVPLRAFFSS